ncbi:LPS export ABC transporter permease LptG [Pseudomonas capeferrum]|uniref:LPS export ABC transporter permease LptG n=1 Tax=Pseudomonas capeferrum TaxID=1495066 RepID=UPI0015E3E11A|nr:LPS export ABC transporter permease LptG [Pseudomonas capeferrum]MBA1200203.1 LPS export ABC transporter permease LptG [Pseudomonas capeferrum]
MNIWKRYLVKNVFVGFLAAAALLIPLFTTFDLINELDDVSAGGYRWTQAVAVVLLTLPRRLIDLGPFIALLGGIVGLGQLAISQELTAMRAAGVSVINIALVAVAAGTMLTVSLAALDEWVASPLQQRALQMRDVAINSSDEAANARGTLWARRGNEVARIDALAAHNRPKGIEIFRYNQDLSLASYIHADEATVLQAGSWMLKHVNFKQWSNGEETVQNLNTLQWASIFSSIYLKELTLPSDSFSVKQLSRYILFLKDTDQPAEQYRIALWQKFGRPILTLAMILLAVPFTFVQQRSPGLGSRLAVGAIVGLLTYVGNQIIVNLGLLFTLDPGITSLLPPLMILSVALALVYRFDRRA